MNKELPKVYANKINKEIKNNKKTYVYKGENNISQDKKHTNSINDIEKIINQLFNRRGYVYKVPVKIETDTEIIKTQIIGRNRNNIITRDNKIIEIKKIKAISEINKKENE